MAGFTRRDAVLAGAAMAHLCPRHQPAGNHILDHALTQRRDGGRREHGEFQSLSEVAEDLDPQGGAPRPVTPALSTGYRADGRRPIGSCIPHSGLSRSDFVHSPRAGIGQAVCSWQNATLCGHSLVAEAARPRGLAP